MSDASELAGGPPSPPWALSQAERERAKLEKALREETRIALDFQRQRDDAHEAYQVVSKENEDLRQAYDDLRQKCGDLETVGRMTVRENQALRRERDEAKADCIRWVERAMEVTRERDEARHLLVTLWIAAEANDWDSEYPEWDEKLHNIPWFEEEEGKIDHERSAEP